MRTLSPSIKQPARRRRITSFQLVPVARAIALLTIALAATPATVFAQDSGVVQNVHIEMDPPAGTTPEAAAQPAAAPAAMQPRQATVAPDNQTSPPILTRADISRLVNSLKTGQTGDAPTEGLGPGEEVVRSPAPAAPMVPTVDLPPQPQRVAPHGHFPAPPNPTVDQMPGQDPAVLHVRHGVTADFQVSSTQPNMVVTPFTTPKVIAKKVGGEDPSGSRVLGTDVFFSPKEETTVFVKDAAVANSPVVSLHLLPAKIAGRSVTLVLDGAIPEGSNIPQSAGEDSGYVGGITAAMKQAVLGQIPDGYTEAPLDAPMAISGPIKASPVGRYAGSDADIYRYHLTNAGTESVTLSEEAFGSEHVLAVTIFPNLAVRPGETTDVFIMFAKQVM